MSLDTHSRTAPLRASAPLRSARSARSRRDPDSARRVQALIDHAIDLELKLVNRCVGGKRCEWRDVAAHSSRVAEAYLVAADAAEEGGFGVWAYDLRGEGRRRQVAAWASQRFRKTITGGDVGMVRVDGERNRFIVYVSGWPNYESYQVAVDRRGRVRVVRRHGGGMKSGAERLRGAERHVAERP